LELIDRKYFSTGELHFLRSESDLHSVIVNTMESISILIQLINKHKKKYLGSMNVTIRWVSALEKVVSKLLKGIVTIYKVLEVKKRVICLPGYCVTMECTDIVVTKLTVLLIELQQKYKRRLIISIIGQVFFVRKE
jgi:hypothetical protein